LPAYTETARQFCTWHRAVPPAHPFQDAPAARAAQRGPATLLGPNGRSQLSCHLSSTTTSHDNYIMATALRAGDGFGALRLACAQNVLAITDN